MTHSHDLEAADGPVPLAELQDAILDEATVDALFFDVAAAAELLAVVVKGQATRDAAPAEMSLDAARTALRDGPVHGVQLRYRYRGAEWWDTLLRVTGGVRLVRIQQTYA